MGGGPIRGAAGEARGCAGQGGRSGHAAQGGRHDVGHDDRAHAALLLLSQRAGLGHTNGIKCHRGAGGGRRRGEREGGWDLGRKIQSDKRGTGCKSLAKGRFMVLC